jgi:hypothetical protein
MESCYLVSISVLEEILDPLATLEACYRVVPGKDTVTVIRFGPAGVLQQVAFPVVYRIPGVPENEGTLILMVATEQSRKLESFWKPVETQLVRTSVYPSA